MTTVPVQEVLPVRSRVNMSAIFAGAAVALAVYVLLNLLGIALGLSVTSRSTDEQLGLGAAAWALGSLLVALFCGGFIVSQCTVGETGGEAAIYGVIMWGLVFAFLLWLSTTTVRFGFNGVMSMASAPSAVQTTNNTTTMSDADLKQAGFTDDEIQRHKAYFERLGQAVGSQIRAEAADPRAIPAAWWTFAGVLFSMLAAMVGAICGSGPQVVVAGFPVRARFVPTLRRTPVVR